METDRQDKEAPSLTKLSRLALNQKSSGRIPDGNTSNSQEVKCCRDFYGAVAAWAALRVWWGMSFEGELCTDLFIFLILDFACEGFVNPGGQHNIYLTPSDLRTRLAVADGAGSIFERLARSLHRRRTQERPEPAMNTSASGTSSWSYSLRANFYALTPAETYYETVWQVPNIVGKALPVMMLMSVIEAVVLKLTNRSNNWRLHIAVLNYSCGSLSESLYNFVFRGAELSAYIWVYSNWCLGFLAWDSLSTYFLALLGVEFCYYWWHRASHEMSLMWAAHSAHHSSEDFNMTVTARTSWTMRPFRWIFFLPLAFLGLPPSAFLIHQQLSYVYAGWTHNETVPKLSKVIPGLGHAIEFVFMTPSHHRVHHGANRYCIDKNYGQTFIIFDRLFGTFAEERDDEPYIIYI
nr:alkylglycerol monooxygenase-like [Penaeus vannamei]